MCVSDGTNLNYDGFYVTMLQQTSFLRPGARLKIYKNSLSSQAVD